MREHYLKYWNLCLLPKGFRIISEHCLCSYVLALMGIKTWQLWELFRNKDMIHNLTAVCYCSPSPVQVSAQPYSTQEQRALNTYCCIQTGWRSPWRKGMIVLFSQVKPQPAQWGFSNLCQLNCGCRLKKQSVRLPSPSWWRSPPSVPPPQVLSLPCSASFCHIPTQEYLPPPPSHYPLPRPTLLRAYLKAPGNSSAASTGRHRPPHGTICNIQPWRWGCNAGNKAALDGAGLFSWFKITNHGSMKNDRHYIWK